MIRHIRRLLIAEYALVEDIISDLQKSSNDVRKLRRLHRKLVRLSTHVHDKQYTILYRKLVVDLPDTLSTEDYRVYQKDIQAMLSYLKGYHKTLQLRNRTRDTQNVTAPIT